MKGGGGKSFKSETKRKRGLCGSGIGCLVCFTSVGHLSSRFPGIWEHAVEVMFQVG